MLGFIIFPCVQLTGSTGAYANRVFHQTKYGIRVSVRGAKQGLIVVASLARLFQWQSRQFIRCIFDLAVDDMGDGE